MKQQTGYICGECEQEYTEHETADWIYMWRM